jgi:hypothetical protein
MQDIIILAVAVVIGVLSAAAMFKKYGSDCIP